jgi:hypothetical protein
MLSFSYGGALPMRESWQAQQRQEQQGEFKVRLPGVNPVWFGLHRAVHRLHPVMRQNLAKRLTEFSFSFFSWVVSRFPAK